MTDLGREQETWNLSIKTRARSLSFWDSSEGRTDKSPPERKLLEVTMPTWAERESEKDDNSRKLRALTFCPEMRWMITGGIEEVEPAEEIESISLFEEEGWEWADPAAKSGGNWGEDKETRTKSKELAKLKPRRRQKRKLSTWEREEGPGVTGGKTRTRTRSVTFHWTFTELS